MDFFRCYGKRRVLITNQSQHIEFGLVTFAYLLTLKLLHYYIFYKGEHYRVKLYTYFAYKIVETSMTIKVTILINRLTFNTHNFSLIN